MLAAVGRAASRATFYSSGNGDKGCRVWRPQASKGRQEIVLSDMIVVRAQGTRQANERADGMAMMRKRNVQDLGDASCRECGCRCVARAQICRDEAAAAL